MMLMTKPPMTLLKAGVGRMMREAYITYMVAVMAIVPNTACSAMPL